VCLWALPSSSCLRRARTGRRDLRNFAFDPNMLEILLEEGAARKGVPPMRLMWRTRAAACRARSEAGKS
jgi:hypothetical protein